MIIPHAIPPLSQSKSVLPCVADPELLFLNRDRKALCVGKEQRR